MVLLASGFAFMLSSGLGVRVSFSMLVLLVLQARVELGGEIHRIQHIGINNEKPLQIAA